MRYWPLLQLGIAPKRSAGFGSASWQSFWHSDSTPFLGGRGGRGDCHLCHLRQGECHDRPAGSERNILLAVECVTDGRRNDPSAGLEFPKHLARARIKSNQVTLSIAAEHQPSSRGKHAGGRRADHVETPLRLAGGWVNRKQPTSAVFSAAAFHIAGLIPLPFRETLLGLKTSGNLHSN